MRVDDLAIRRPTLDDVFITLTGHVAEHENGDRADRDGDAPADGDREREYEEARR